MAKFNPTEKINPLKQVGIMKQLLSNPTVTTMSNSAILQGEIFVSPEISTYKISIKCSVERSPKVKILNPKIKDNAKHLYNDKTLCLYHPTNFKWQEKPNIIVKQIVPWTAVWIYFYEYWLQTGKWIGPEVPHSKKKQ
jgi:hypothetical protein